MWKTFKNSDNVFLVKATKGDSSLRVCITDFVNLWESEVKADDFVKDFQALNVLIEASPEQIITNFLKTIDNISTLKTSINNIDADLEFSIECAADLLSDDALNRSINYRLRLARMDQKEFSALLTVPAIKTIYYLEEQRKTLLNTIQKKDRELEEFRMEKGDISRGDLRTEKFDQDVLKSDQEADMLLNIFNQSADVWQQFSTKNGVVVTSNLQVEVDPWNRQPKRKIVHTGKKVIKKGSGVVFKN